MKREERTKLAERARYLRRNMTEAEKKLWHSFLKNYPIHFGAQILVGRYIVDFYCKKARLSIELDGSQHYTPRGQRYDQVRTTYLEMMGIKELRFPNTYLWSDFEGVCEVIHSEVEKRRNDIRLLDFELIKSKQ